MAESDSAEPTVLDWFHSLLRLDPIPIPEPSARADQATAQRSLETGKPAPPRAAAERTRPAEHSPSAEGGEGRIGLGLRAAHLRLPVALLLALLAQLNLERHQSVGMSVAFYLVAAGLLGWSLWLGDFGQLPVARPRSRSAAATFDPRYLTAGLASAILAFLLSAGNTFRFPTLVFWGAAVLLTGRAFWQGAPPGSGLLVRARGFAARPRLRITLDQWSLLVLGALALAAIFRFAHLDTVPYEMWSDHAEKFLDIVDILNGKTSIFFPRNSGREGMQFYATAAAIKWFGASYSFLTLKSITALLGWLTLPYIYLFGRQLGGRKVGLAALSLAGIAYWPNVLGRVGMRLPLFPVFLAPAMYYLLRGLGDRKQNDFVWAGLFVGLGVYGYTPARIVPLVIALGVGLYLAHRVARGHRREVLIWLAVAALVAIVVSAPFLRVASEFPDEVFYRTLTRVTSAERPLPGPALQIFLSNMWNALRMFSWDFGEIWVLAIPFRPALDWITGSLFHLGVGLLIVRYLKTRDWKDLYLLLSIPVLLLPSVLSLAFPGENPHPSRAEGAIIPVFTIAAIALVAIWDWSSRLGFRRRVSVGLIGGLFLISALTNYNLAINRYGDIERRGTWNTTEAGAAAKGFAESVGDLAQVHMVAYPYWMDSRLVALIAGRPGDDFGLWPQLIDELPPTDQPQLFLLHPDDTEDLTHLQTKFPTGTVTRHYSPVDGRDFLLLLVPGAGS